MIPAFTAPFQTYDDFLTFLDNLDVSVMKLGTERIQKVLSQLDRPQDQVKTIHVVGTNGKGSVCSLLSSIYRAAGYQTGLFISPHLIDLRERIQLNGVPLSPSKMLEAAHVVYEAMIRALPDPKDALTFFEYLNVMAFWVFAHQPVDIAIIEAGLGGRLDSTNVIAQPEAVVVTSISLDHQDRLGHTVEAIALEKAGVFRAGCPVWSARQTPTVACVLQEKAVSVGTTVYEASANRIQVGTLSHKGTSVFRNIRDTQIPEKTYSLALLGRYQSENLSLVLSIVEALQARLPVTPEALQVGLETVSWPGRFQYFPAHQLVIDGSHNVAGFESLFHTLALDFPDTPIHWGLSLLTNRPLQSFKPFLSYANTRQIDFLAAVPSARFHSPEAFQNWVAPFGVDYPVTFGRTVPAFVEERPSSGNVLRVLTGSLYTSGVALKNFLQE